MHTVVYSELHMGQRAFYNSTVKFTDVCPPTVTFQYESVNLSVINFSQLFELP